MKSKKNLKRMIKNSKRKVSHKESNYSIELRKILSSKCLYPTVSPNAYPEFFNIARLKNIAAIYQNIKKTESKTRVKLMDYVNKRVGVVGNIVDIIVSKDNKHFRILLEEPAILRKIRKDEYDSINFDSHLWIKTDIVDSTSDDLKLAIGETLVLDAVVTPYRGKATNDNHRGYKYGFKDVHLITSGIVSQEGVDDFIDLTKIRTNYPEKDWVLSFSHDNGKSKVETRKSKYPRYNEIMDDDKLFKSFFDSLMDEINEMLIKYGSKRNIVDLPFIQVKD